MKQSIIIILFILLLIPNCKDKESRPDQFSGPYYLNEVRDYIYFKTGTWWVYQNSLTNARDCVYVNRTDTAFARVKHKMGNTPDTYYHYVDYTAFQSFMYSTYNKCEYRIYDLGVSTEGFGYNMKKEYSCQLPYSNTSLLWFFSYPFTREVITARYDSLVVKNKTYYKVVVFENNNESDPSLKPLNDNSFEYAYKPTYYWAKNYGIIKSTITTQRRDDRKSFDASWELIKSNIIQ